MALTWDGIAAGALVPKSAEGVLRGGKRAFPQVVAELSCASSGSLAEQFSLRGCFLLWLCRLAQKMVGGMLRALWDKGIAWTFVTLQNRQLASHFTPSNPGVQMSI